VAGGGDVVVAADAVGVWCCVALCGVVAVAVVVAVVGGVGVVGVDVCCRCVLLLHRSLFLGAAPDAADVVRDRVIAGDVGGVRVLCCSLLCCWWWCR